jgi:hypothetical protein
MSATGAETRLRPLGIGEILDASVKVYRSNFRTLTLAVLVVIAPITVLGTLITASTAENAFNYTDTSATTVEDEGTFIAGQLISSLLSGLAFAVALAACFHGVMRGYIGEGATWQESVRFGLKRLLPIIGLMLLFLVMLLPLLFVLGILVAIFWPLVFLAVAGFIWLAVRLSLAVPAMLAEDIGPPSAIGRSFNLVGGRWWPTFGALVAMFILVGILQGLVGLLMGIAFADAENELLAAIVFTIISTLAYVVTLPIQSAVFTLLYYDLRVRKEGYDLQLAMSGDGHVSAPAAPQTWGPSDASQSTWGPADPSQSSAPPGGGFTPPSTPTPAPAAFGPPATQEAPAPPAFGPPATQEEPAPETFGPPATDDEERAPGAGGPPGSA